MKWWLKKKECCGCAACYNACPVSAISMNYDDEGFLYPHFDSKLCIDCGRCIKACPIGKRTTNRTKQFENAYACYRNDMALRMKSSSGGMFSVMAEYVLDMGGIVCGAVFDEKLNVKHEIIKDISDLEKVRGSKYIQSDINDCYKIIRQYLNNEYFVLFSGTPCQVAGLKTFLTKDYDNLVTIEVICHGVPSTTVWQKHLQELSNNTKIVNITFRNKEKGMKNIVLDYLLEDGKLIIENYGESNFIKGFTQNLYLRPSCYKCQFKIKNSYSDITIGDFWGIEYEHPGFGDEFGVSAVLIKNEKGNQLLQSVADQCTILGVDEKEIEIHNESMIEAAADNKMRKTFYYEISVNTFSNVIKKLYDPEYWSKIQNSFGKKVRRKVSSLIKRLD